MASLSLIAFQATWNRKRSSTQRICKNFYYSGYESFNKHLLLLLAWRFLLAPWGSNLLVSLTHLKMNNSNAIQNVCNDMLLFPFHVPIWHLSTSLSASASLLRTSCLAISSLADLASLRSWVRLCWLTALSSCWHLCTCDWRLDCRTYS